MSLQSCDSILQVVGAANIQIKYVYILSSWNFPKEWQQTCIIIDVGNFGMLCTVTPHTRCRLKLLKLERIKDFLLMEEELIRNQERQKPQEQKNEVSQVKLLGLKHCIIEIPYAAVWLPPGQ